MIRKGRGSVDEVKLPPSSARPTDVPVYALSHEDTTWTLRDGVSLVIGREPGCDVWIDAPAVSRRHAVVRTVGHETTIEDLGSRHGVYVNAKRILHPTVVRFGDRIVLGDVVLSVARPPRGATDRPPSLDRGVRITEPVPVTDLGLDALAVFASVGGRALRAGRTRQATMIATHLYESMMDAGPGSADAAAQVGDTSQLLAWICSATQEGAWLDRIFTLRLTFRSPMDAATLRSLAQLARDVPVPPCEARHAYLAWLRARDLGDDQRAALAELATAGS